MTQRGLAMLIDANDLDAGSTIGGDAVIIGGGPAGIAIALSLSRLGIETVLVESGGLEFNPAIQELATGTISGRNYTDLDATRLRLLGGTSNHWGGRCLPLVEHDFAQRGWIPLSGWPITYDSLKPYYQRAHDVLQLGGYSYDPAAAVRHHGGALFPFEDGPPRSVLSRKNPLRLGRAYREDLEHSKNCTVCLNGHVLYLKDNNSGKKVNTAKIISSHGRPFSLIGRHFVIATGGIENPRLLMLSERNGNGYFGNEGDQVGRHFMEHLWITAGLLVMSDRNLDFSMYVRDFRYQGVNSVLTLAYDAQFLEQQQLPNMYFEFKRQRGFWFTEEIEAANSVARDLSSLKWPDNFSKHIMTMARNLDTFIDAAAEDLLGDTMIHKNKPQAFQVFSYGEQVPNPESRVRLADVADKYGLPKTDLVWRTTAQDHDAIRRSASMLAAEAGRVGLGRMRLEPGLREPGLPRITGGNHHMGTTRMSTSPRTGVVDTNCRVHGMANLYVAGSSVFPTSGYANPTLTIVALALRLADHLQGELG
jgi:choline dehydrogenase-like flavoprotein